jgi:thiamine biosynthesis protein ThiI
MREKVVFAFSGGIDSFLAFIMLKKRYSVFPVHFSVARFYDRKYPFVLSSLFKIAREKLGMEKLYLVPFSDVLEKIRRRCKRKYRCVVCRKAMLYACDLLCEKFDADFIATAEVIAQKASQTLYNITATHSNLKHTVLMPICFFDKEQIVNILRKKGIEISQHIGSCRLAPKYPVTMCTPSRLRRIFSECELEDLIETCVEDCIAVEKPEDVERIINEWEIYEEG